MKALTIFGLIAVTAMLVSYPLEKRSHWFNRRHYPASRVGDEAVSSITSATVDCGRS